MPTFGRPRIATRIASSPTGRSPPPGSRRDDLVEQVAGAVAVQRRERDRIAEPEPVELERLGVAARVVELVRDDEHGAPRRAQDLGELLVARRDSRLRVDDEEHEIGLLDRLPRLLGDLRPERPRVLAVDAARCRSRGTCRRSSRRELLAVARDAGRLVDDGGPRLGEPVDERRLADVREADDRDRAGDLGDLVGRTGSGARPLLPRGLIAAASRRAGGRARGARRATPRARGACARSRATPPCSPCPRAGARRSVIGSPQAIDTGAKFPSRQVWLPWIAAGISGTASLIATMAAPGCTGPGTPLALPRSLREHAERVPVAHDLAHHPHGVAVGLASADRERPERPHQLAEPRHAVRLDLRHEVERARARRAERRGIDPAEVVRRDDQAARPPASARLRRHGAASRA